jgi:hypothetical protein
MAYKYTSEVFQISASATEAAPNAGASTTINLSLDSLSREILVIQYVDMDLNEPDLVGGARTSMDASLNNAGTTVAGLSNANTIAAARTTVLAGSGAGAGGIDAAVSFQNNEPKVANGAEDIPLYVSATDDLFLAVKGAGNTGRLGQVQVRIFARRAKADADTYAAILTSQFN